MNSKETLKEKKLRLEEELKKINTQIANEDKLEYVRDLVESKLKEVQKVFPTLDMEVDYSGYSNVLYLRESAVNNKISYYRHTIDLDDVESTLEVLDDILVNTDKYFERYALLTELGAKLRLHAAYLVLGTVSYEVVHNILSTDVVQQVKVCGEFDVENKLNVDIVISHILEDNFTDNYKVNVDGFDFDVEVCVDNLDNVDFYDTYHGTLEGIAVESLSGIIDRLKLTARNHSIVVNTVKGK